MAGNRANIQMYALRGQMPLPRAGLNGELPSGNIAPRFHRFADANRQSITALQSFSEYNRKSREILLFETTDGGWRSSVRNADEMRRIRPVTQMKRKLIGELLHLES